MTTIDHLLNQLIRNNSDSIANLAKILKKISQEKICPEYLNKILQELEIQKVKEIAEIYANFKWKRDFEKKELINGEI
jgi:hypothetical protein